MLSTNHCNDYKSKGFHEYKKLRKLCNNHLGHVKEKERIIELYEELYLTVVESTHF